MNILRKTLPKLEKNELGIAYPSIHMFDYFAEFVVSRNQDSFEEINKHLSKELNIAYLDIIAIGSLAMSILQENEGFYLFPRNWISNNNIPDPNVILQNLLVQIANHSLAITELVQNGLDNPARALIRINCELSWITLVITFDKDKMAASTTKKDDENWEKQIWHKYFKLNKLVDSLTEIERKLGLPDDVLESLKKSRLETYKFYSEDIHSSFGASMIGALGADFTSDNMQFGLFGVASLQSKATLNNLNLTLYYFIKFFLSILKDNTLYFDIENEFCYWSRCLVSTSIDAYEKLVLGIKP